MDIVHLAVTPEHDGLRLDRYLADAVAGVSRSRLQQLIRDGQVTVGGRTVRPSAAVHSGDTIVVTLPAPVETAVEAEPIPLDVVYEDEDLLVINKPAGLVAHPAPGHAGGTLVNALLHHVKDLSGIGGERRPGLVHRLDRGTSGLMVVAKHDQAHEALARQFHDREVEKEYVALVWGGVQAGRRIDLAIGRDPVHRRRMSARARRARTAVTRITRAVTVKGVSLVRVVIQSGRTHQIRVHLSAIGHPVVGDPLYGGVRRRIPGDLRALAKLDRPFLHAARLAFHHPRDGRPMEFTAPLPPDLQAALDGIRPATLEPEQLKV
ncbi:MAG TPA: RluA family pseudouridine synthase [Vicinamibacterales bacterium]|nr:RluA family pseudouridine synthase [Vicinamibacterales bacterium]